MSEGFASRDLRRARLLLAFATIYVVWGSTYLAIARAIETIPPLTMTGVRSLIAGSILYAWSLRHGAAKPSARNWRAALLTGALLVTGAYGLIAWAELRIPSGVTALLAATAPLWAVGIAQVWRGSTRPGAAAVLGTLAGVLGVGLLVGAGLPGGLDRLATAAVIGSALFWSLGSYVARGGGLPESLSQAAGMQLLAGGALLVALAAAVGEPAAFDATRISTPSIVALAYLILFGSVAGYSAYAYALRETSPVLVTTHAFVNPLIAVVLGWALAGEAVTPGILAGGVLIAAAVVLITLDRRPIASRARRRVPWPRARFPRWVRRPVRP